MCTQHHSCDLCRYQSNLLRAKFVLQNQPIFISKHNPHVYATISIENFILWTHKSSQVYALIEHDIRDYYQVLFKLNLHISDKQIT